MGNRFPQVLAFGKLSSKRTITINKNVRKHLGVTDETLYLSQPDEILLSPKKAKGAAKADSTKSKLCLPSDVCDLLRLEKGDQIVMLQREGAVAIKKFVIEFRQGEQSMVSDIETPLLVTRKAVTNMPPDALLPKLAKKHAKKKLKHSVKKFLKGRDSFEAWQARQLLDASDADDESRRKAMIKDRLDAQSSDGSWDGKVMLTARMLTELHELGVTAKKKEVKSAVKWLLERDESEVNPGMFFLTDELVALQRECRAEKKRFRDRKKVELQLNVEADPMIRESCGPRILWPNGYALDALVRFGYEKNDRVQRALKSGVVIGWCECGAQMGHGILQRDGSVLTSKEIEAAIDTKLERCATKEADHFSFGGLEGEKGLTQLDPNYHATLARIGHERKNGKDVYTLRMPGYVGTCEPMSMRGYWYVKDERLRRKAMLHTGTLVGRQHPDGKITRGHRFLHNTQAFYLHTLSMFDHPYSRVGVMRYIPWVIANQNSDGSWGKDPHKDITTLLIVQALLRTKHYLPKGMVP